MAFKLFASFRYAQAVKQLESESENYKLKSGIVEWGGSHRAWRVRLDGKNPWHIFDFSSMILSENNVKSELSYAYLHAVSAKACFSCKQGDRHDDGVGVDAILRVKERFCSESVLTNFSIDIQLKATSILLPEKDNKFSFNLSIKNYNELRDPYCSSPQLLVVLILPSDPTEWLIHTNEKLESRRCAYWLSLFNAPHSTNSTKQTVYIPTCNQLTAENLRGLAETFSKGEHIEYAS